MKDQNIIGCIDFVTLQRGQVKSFIVCQTFTFVFAYEILKGM